MGGQSRPRIAPSELDLDRSLRRRRRPALLLRHVDDRWVEVARFGSVAEAEAAVDGEVGAGRGTLGEYRVTPVRGSRLATVAIVAAVVATLALLVAAAALALLR